MAKYRKIDPRIWNDKKFRSFTDDGKLVFLFLLTHPHMTSVGAMRTTQPGLAAELNWRPERFTTAFASLEDAEVIRFDSHATFLWLPRFVRYNQPESPNVVAAWRGQLDELPECELLDQLKSTLESEIAQLGRAFADAWTHGKTAHQGKPNLEVIQVVRERDLDRCRYCGVEVNWKDRRGSIGGTYDHINPRGLSDVDNIVVCCRKCNSTKGLRTPSQAKMILLPLKLHLGNTQVPPSIQE